jgi:ATP/maltotriose-dependent transcriptional regulator MalT/DNA-binding SARP family transcriptional activator
VTKSSVHRRVGSARLLPPAVVTPALARTRLEQRLDDALDRRLAIVVAGAGFGKTTLLSGWAARKRVAWYSLMPEDAELGTLVRGLVGALRLRIPGLPTTLVSSAVSPLGAEPDPGELGRADAYAEYVCAALHDLNARDLVLVLDDLHELGDGGAAARLVESFVRHAPPLLHVVLASRVEPPFPIERLRGRGQVVELTARELAFSADETDLLVGEALGNPEGGLAEELHEATGGWPAAVRLALEALRTAPPTERARTLAGLRGPGSPLFAYLAGEVLEREPADVQELVRMVAPLGPFTAELCEALGVAGASEVLVSLERRGLFVEPDPQDVGWYSLGALTRELALERMPLPKAELNEARLRAATWLATRGHLERAAALLAAAEAHEELAALLSERGEELLAAGAVDAVVRFSDLLPPELRSPVVERLSGEARQAQGDWDGALACFERAGKGTEELDPGIAWRAGLVHHLRGDLDEAASMYARARLDGSASRDEALALAWQASLEWLRGDFDACRELGGRAHEIASRAGDAQALAASHTVLALMAAYEGDRVANDAHYVRALEHAERARDVLQIIRIHVNRGSRRMEEAEYEDSIAELDIALRLADLAGYAFLRALALNNRGTARFRLGRLEEAMSDLEAAKTLYQQLGSLDVAYPLASMGEIFRCRGDLALARAVLEEAADRADAAGDVQALVPALSGLARVLASEEPERAAELADRAVAYGRGMGFVGAVLAAAEVAISQGDHASAGDLAEAAAAESRARRDRAGLAEALELGSVAEADSAPARSHLEEAIAIWREIHGPLGEARARLALAKLVPSAEGRALALEAEERLTDLGARGLAASARALLAEFDQVRAAAVAVESLGRFRVLRGGRPVPLAAWQSKKARDLLKFLVSRRGRPTPREVVMEALWPGGDPARVGNRLSVALSTLRSVLDPERRFAQDRFVGGDKDVLHLEVTNLDIDVERFLAEAQAGLSLLDEGDTSAARGRLVQAEALYAGDFLEEDAYEDWPIALREEARATYIAVARALGKDALARGDADLAARYFLRTLEKDRHDEEVHLALVSLLASAGRHGEARRAYRSYVARMEEISVEAAPYPGALRSP